MSADTAGDVDGARMVASWTCGLRACEEEESARVDEQPGLLGQLARAVAGAGEDPLALRLCRAYAALVDVDGVAITLANTDPHTPLTLCATDATADRLEDLQEIVGEGPGSEAYRSGGLVTASLAAVEGTRWPLFTEAARNQVGALQVYAFPMRTGSEVIGALTGYQTRPRALAHDLDDAQFLADAVGVAIARQATTQGELAAQSWMVRDKIHQATGMVVAQARDRPRRCPGTAACLRLQQRDEHGRRRHRDPATAPGLHRQRGRDQ